MSIYLAPLATERQRTSTGEIDLGRFPMRTLLEGCVENLLTTYSESEGLFPFSTSLVDDRLENVYGSPHAVRYTVSSLLGLAEAARYGIGSVTSEDVRAMTERFLIVRPERLTSVADLGLLALHLSANVDNERMLEDAVARLNRALEREDAGRLDLQDLSWVAWGMTGAARQNVNGAEQVAKRSAQLIAEHYVDATAILPRHSTRWYRRSIVSFGSVTYYLRAAHEVATTFGDEVWSRRFRDGVGWALQHQGPQGEWPWLMDTRSGTPIDVYPIFSVHQDSMAMLFLIPGFQDGMPGAAPAIERSLAWGFGDNELGAGFYTEEPFIAHRSIERVESFPRLRRYLRSLARRRAETAAFGNARVRINPESRSYHLGWILYVWSARIAEGDGRTGGPR